MGFIYNGNDLFLRHRILWLIKSNTKWPCCQLGNKGYAHSKRIQDPGKKSYNLHIPICIFFRVIGSDSPECKNTKRRKQNEHQCKHQDQCSQMLYVGMKGLGSPWNDKCSETDSGSHNNQRNRIDKWNRIVDQGKKKDCFLISFLRPFLRFVFAQIVHCSWKSIKNTIQPQKQ